MTPYKLQYHQQLSEEDYANRVAACADLLDLQEQILTFLDNLWMTDEATFNVNVHVNKHNCWIWGWEKLASVLTKNQGSSKVTVWAALTKSGIIEPYFFYENLNGSNYQQMLPHFLSPIWNVVESLALLIFNKMERLPILHALFVNN